MVDIAVTGAVDLSAYDTQSNTRIRFDEVLELSGKNHFYNPDLLDLDKDGGAINTQMDAPPEPQGWAVSMQKLTPAPPGLETRQSLPAIPMSRNLYTQVGPIIRGPGIPDPAERARMAQPLRPRFKIITDAVAGYETGWLAIAYGWIVADTAKPAGAHVHLSPFITDPSPRFYIQITSDGQVPRVWLPATAPQGAVGVYIACCNPQANQAAASIADLWIQRRIDTRQGQMLYYDLFGFSKDERAPATNQAASGAFQRWPAPDRKYGNSTHGVMYDFVTRLSYRFSTINGVSLAQNQTQQFQSRGVGENKELRWRPRRLASNADKWQPIFKRGESYYALPWRPLDQWAVIRHTDPKHIQANVEPIKYDAAGRDGTGLGGPDTEIEQVELVGKPQLAVGQYRMRAWWYDDEGQLSPPSPPAEDPLTGRRYADITALGQTIRVYRPQYGNAVPNGNTAVPDRTHPNRDPQDWTITRSANFTSIVTDTGQITVRDSSGSTSSETFATTPLTDIMADEPDDRWYTLRIGVNISRFVGGRVALRVLYFDKNETLLSTGALLAGIGSTNTGIYKAYGSLNDTAHTVARIAKLSAALPAGVTRDEAIPVAARYFKVEVRAIGASAGTGDGPRNMDYTVTAIGAMRGVTIPRRMPIRVRPVPDIESYEDFYPPGGFAAIEVNPRNSKRHSDLVGINMNAFIYYGPYGTPNSPEYGITGMGTPVKPNNDKRVSVYAEYDGVYSQTNAIHFSGRDRRGRIVQDFGYMVPNARGSIAPTRFSKTLNVGPDTVWIELDECNLSDGFWRIMGFQMEAGTSTTAWSNTKASPGTRTWVFDAGAPDAPAGSVNEFLGGVREVVRGLTDELDGVGGNDPDYAGTTVTTAYQTSVTDDPYMWSASQSNPRNCPPGRFWRVTVTMTTTDLTLSPVVSRAGVEIRRPWAVLLTADGNEFPGGGCIVNSFPIVAGSRRVEEFISDSNEYEMFVSGEWLYEMAGVNLYCQSRRGAEAVVAYRHSKRPFILESALRGKRIRAFAPEISFDPVEDGVSIDPLAPDGHWDEQSADGVVFKVTAETNI